MIKVELKVDNNNKDPALTKEKEHYRIGLENYECVCVLYSWFQCRAGSDP